MPVHARRSRMRHCLATLAVGASLSLTGTPAFGALVINEVQSSNVATVADSDGDYPDWIELFNAGDTAVNAGGYGLSDDPNDYFLLTLPARNIPPGGLLVVWASDKDTVYANGEIHARFKLKSDGEDIYLTTPDALSIQRVPGVAIPTDASFGRKPDGADNWLFFNEPTPGARNTTAGYQAMLGKPSFSHAAGFYPASFELALLPRDPGETLRYTLDGSEPNDSSAVYAGPLTIVDRTGPASGGILVRTTTSFHPFHVPQADVFRGTVVRARAYRAGHLPSDAATATFFVTPLADSRYTLPVLSLATDSGHLFAPDSGIYVPGPAAAISNTHLTLAANFQQRGDEWERPVHVEFLEDGGTLAVSQDAGMRVNGNYAREYHQKSLRLHARSRYGRDWFEHRFFPEKTVDRFKTILLRTASSDIFTAIIRDAVIQTLSAGLGFDTQSYRPVVVFINGDNWGINFLRDRYDPNHLRQHNDVDPDNVDLLEIDAGPQVESGDAQHYESMTSYIRSGSMAAASAYQHVSEMMDLENYATYFAAQIVAGNTDWPHKNVRLWRRRSDYDPQAPYGHDGRWRWMMYDTERGFGLRVSSTPDYNTLDWAVGTSSQLRQLLQNAGFRALFINRYSDLRNTAFSDRRMRAVIDSLTDQISDEMPEHIARWGEPSSMSRWEDHLDVMRDFALRRHGYAREHYRAHFGLGAETSLTVDVTPPLGGHGRVNGLEFSGAAAGYGGEPYPWIGRYFPGLPITVAAVPADGYEFVEWAGSKPATTASLEVTLDGPAMMTAVFASPSQVAERALPTAFMLAPNVPNPFNPRTALRFSTAEAGAVRLVVYDVNGRWVCTLVDGDRAAGRHAVVWDGRDHAGRAMASGVYIARLATRHGVLARRLTLVR